MKKTEADKGWQRQKVSGEVAIEQSPNATQEQAGSEGSGQKVLRWSAGMPALGRRACRQEGRGPLWLQFEELAVGTGAHWEAHQQAMVTVQVRGGAWTGVQMMETLARLWIYF